MTLRPDEAETSEYSGAPHVCPNCRVPLSLVSTGRGQLFGCETCRGREVTVYVLRQFLGPQVVKTMWAAAKRASEETGKDCPSCEQSMTNVTIESSKGPLQLDVCTRCQLVWFDADELEAFPPVAVKRDPLLELPDSSRERLAMAHLQLDQRSRDREKQTGKFNILVAVLGVFRYLTWL